MSDLIFVHSAPSHCQLWGNPQTTLLTEDQSYRLSPSIHADHEHDAQIDRNAYTL